MGLKWVEKERATRKKGEQRQTPNKEELKSDLTETPAKDMSLLTKNECVKTKDMKKKTERKRKQFRL